MSAWSSTSRRAGREHQAAVRLHHLRRPGLRLLAGQHPLRLAGLRGDPVGQERAKLVAGRAFGAGLAGRADLRRRHHGQRLKAQKTAIQTPEDLVAYQAAVQGVFTKVTLAFIVVGTPRSGSPPGRAGSVWSASQPRVTIRETFATLKTNKPLAYPVRLQLLLHDRPVRGLPAPPPSTPSTC